MNIIVSNILMDAVQLAVTKSVVDQYRPGNPEHPSYEKVDSSNILSTVYPHMESLYNEYIKKKNN